MENNKTHKTWTEKEITYLKKNYSLIGKMACVNFLKRGEGSVRKKASSLGLKRSSDNAFFRNWQNRARLSKIGKKRPEQSLVIKKLWREGKLKPMTSQKAKELFKDRWKNKPHPKGFKGKTHTSETRKKLGKISKKMWDNPKSYVNSKEYRQICSDRMSKIQNSGMFKNRYSNSKKGTYDINGKKMFFRSLWEVNYALYLDFLIKQKQIKKWEYEVDTFWFLKIKRGVRSYKPDFKVFNNDGSIEYHEVKGWMDNKSKTKLKRMTKYYPDIKVILIEKNIYNDLKKKLGRLLSFYE